MDEQPKRSTKPRTFDEEDTVSEYTASGIFTPTSSRFTSPTRSLRRGRRREGERERERTTGLDGEKIPMGLSVRETIANEARRKRVGRAEVLGEGSSDSDDTETTRTRTPTPTTEEEEPQVKPFRCLICQRRFDTEEEVEAHMVAYGLKKGDTHTQILETPDLDPKNGNKHSLESAASSATPDISTVTHTLFDFPKGTAILRLQHNQTIHTYLISSQILQLASPTLSKTLSLTKPPSLTLHDINPTSLLLLLQMLHHQYSLLPTGFPSFQSLLDFTTIISKYNFLLPCIYPPVRAWAQQYRTANHYYWIFVAHVFGFEDDVRDAVVRLAMEISDYSFDAVIDLESCEEREGLVFLHPRLPKEISGMLFPTYIGRDTVVYWEGYYRLLTYPLLTSLATVDRIRTFRSTAIDELRQFFQKTLTTRTKKGYKHCILSFADSADDQTSIQIARCDMLQLGHLMRTIVEYELQPEGKIWKQSLRLICERLEAIEGMVGEGDVHEDCGWVGELGQALAGVRADEYTLGGR